jgi:hypothetical protein
MRRGAGRTFGGIPTSVAVLLAALLCAPASAEAQLGVRDLVLTGGMSGEGYQGNLPTAGSALQDSTETAAAVVGELGMRGDAYWRRNGTIRGTLFFDGGVRQFAASGFEQRDYAPREWVGQLELSLYQPLGASTTMSLFGGVRGREVQDRTPMPLFLQPAHLAVEAGTSIRTAVGHWTRLEIGVNAEQVNYAAPDFAPQVRLLDRETATGRIAGDYDLGDGHGIEGFVAVDLSEYREQGTFNPEDPYRRDRTFRGRLGWHYSGALLVRAGVEGRLNRSNSRRPEYGSMTVDGQITAPVPGSALATAYVVLTAKRYREAIPFARLLPGEEANSASLVYLTLSRPMARNLDGGVRLGWTRAETETGGEYFQRLGMTFLFTYRPML